MLHLKRKSLVKSFYHSSVTSDLSIIKENAQDKYFTTAFLARNSHTGVSKLALVAFSRVNTVKVHVGSLKRLTKWK